MKTTARIRGFAKWMLTALTVLLLLGWASSPWSEQEFARGRSVQIADGFLTIRMWAGPRAAPGTPSDMAPEGGIPDTRNIPVWIVLLVLAVPTALLWSRNGGRSTASERMRTMPDRATR